MKKNVLLICLIALQASAWNYDWKIRTDFYGKPAGIFDVTPFPIDENTVSYSIKNDEFPNGKTFSLGTKFYVDSARPDNTGDGRSLATAKKTIAAAITAAGAGNKTIIVRKGTYKEFNLACQAGLNDTMRWMVVGYGQERPIVDAGANTSTGTDMFTSTTKTNAFVTLQRLKMQNNLGQAVRLGTSITTKRDGHFSIIDIWVYQCGFTYLTPDDGNIYYLNCDSGWVCHVTTEKSYGHTLKIADGSSGTTIEWIIAANAGYFPGMIPTSYYNCHPGGVQLVADSGVIGTNNIVRYSIIHDALFAGLELRRSANYSVHHNEFYACPHFKDVPGCEAHGQGVGDPSNAIILIHNDHTYGSVYSNVMRDPGKLESGLQAAWLAYSFVTDTNPNYNFNNLYYGAGNYGVYQEASCGTGTMGFYNNDFASGGVQALLSVLSSKSRNNVENNIFDELATGACVKFATGVTKSNNVYYHPQGSRGYTGTLETGGIESNPLFVLTPTSGVYDSEFLILQPTSPCLGSGVSVSSLCGVDFLGSQRPSSAKWDIGAIECSTLLSTRTDGPSLSRATDRAAALQGVFKVCGANVSVPGRYQSGSWSFAIVNVEGRTLRTGLTEGEMVSFLQKNARASPAILLVMADRQASGSVQ